MSRKTVENGLIRGFLLLNKKEEEQGYRTDSTGREKVSLNSRNNYVYNTANDATLKGTEPSIITKSSDVTDKLMSKNLSDFAKDKIERERLAKIAEMKYLGINSQKSYNAKIYTPEQSRSIDNTRQNQSEQVIIPKEFLKSLEDLIETNKTLKSEIDLLKEQRSERRIKKSFSTPKQIKRR